jgi:hypothetical protein
MNGGFLWKLADENLRLGLAFNNFGTTTPMINENGEKWSEGEKLPTSIKAGALYSWKIKSLDFCVAGDILYWHLYDPNDSKIKDAHKRLQFPIGFEFSPLSWLDLRVGKTIIADYNILNFGFALDAQYLNLDFTTTVNKYETSVEWEFLAGVSLNFGTAKKSEVKIKKSLKIIPKEEETETEEPAEETDIQIGETEEVLENIDAKTKSVEIIEPAEEETDLF